MAYSRGSCKNCAIVSCRNNYKKFGQMWANRSICSYSDFNLAYVAEFRYKTGYKRTNIHYFISHFKNLFLFTGYVTHKTGSNRKKKSGVSNKLKCYR